MGAETKHHKKKNEPDAGREQKGEPSKKSRIQFGSMEGRSSVHRT